MATRTEITDTEIADAHRKAWALRTRIAGKRADTKVEFDAGTLRSILKLVSPLGSDRSGLTDIAEPADRPDEISPQEADAILQMTRPSVMGLIGKGRLHPRKILSRNKLSRAEVVAYQREHSRRQREALRNLTALTEEYAFERQIRLCMCKLRSSTPASCFKGG